MVPLTLSQHRLGILCQTYCTARVLRTTFPRRHRPFFQYAYPSLDVLLLGAQNALLQRRSYPKGCAQKSNRRARVHPK